MSDDPVSAILTGPTLDALAQVVALTDPGPDFLDVPDLPDIDRHPGPPPEEDLPDLVLGVGGEV